MTLLSIVNDLDSTDAAETIYASAPWRVESEATTLPTGRRLSTKLRGAGFQRLLKVGAAREAFEIFGAHAATARERARLLIYVAKFKRYPSWALRKNTEAALREAGPETAKPRSDLFNDLPQTLGPAIDRMAALSKLDDDEATMDLTVYARKPWTAASECTWVTHSRLSRRAQEAAQAAGFAYFLEASLVDEVLGVFGDHEPTPDEIRRVVIDYAECDAWPDWAHELRMKAHRVHLDIWPHTPAKPTTLGEVVEQIDEFDPRITIYALESRTPDTACLLVTGGIQSEYLSRLIDAGFGHFLDVLTARHALAGFGAHRPTALEKLRLLTFFAEHRVYPTWLYTLRRATEGPSSTDDKSGS
ncbi:MAG: hypothetical protein KBG48_31840 [Kofleriaceae bacterium]|jgi:hypothetical protein|nr:hypothetical protein [Kofleriaceae bacterium]MBP9172029.1 hypothetical protein [Kofleriaceae bacterium]MBP9862680.1 hypothetical protein [Kofleriaceae bacterium]